jgi:arsenite-transporting ATPase
MSLLETQRFLQALRQLQIPVGGLFINRILAGGNMQQHLLPHFLVLADGLPVFTLPQQKQEPVGMVALDCLIAQVQQVRGAIVVPELPVLEVPVKLPPGLPDFIAAGRRLILVGGKGGVGKTTVAAAIAWGIAERHPESNLRVISIDPAHSLGDAVGRVLGHDPVAILPNLTGQEVDADRVLEQFREEYLWELAEMMSGESGDTESGITLAYGPAAWRSIVSQALPGIDEMLSLVTVIDLLESNQQDLIILDTAPTGHLLRFLEMPLAMADWLAWIFKLWIKYQDVLGRTEFMGRLRQLRQRVMQTQKKLKDAQHTEFIGVVQAQSAILAEAQRLETTLQGMGIAQHYVIHNRYQPEQESVDDHFPNQTIIRLPVLPCSISPSEQIQLAARLLF